jgi:hypothetical protein
MSDTENNYPIDENGIVRAEQGPVPVTVPADRDGDSRTAEVRGLREQALPQAAPVLVAPSLPPDLAHRLTENDVESFGRAARRIGLSDGQAQSILNLYADRVRANADANRRPTYAGTVTTLKAEWGDAMPRKLAAASRAVEALGGDRLREHLRQTGLTNDEHLVRMFADLGEKMNREQMQRTRVVRGASVDRETVLIEYDRRMRDPEDPYWNARHPDHKRAVAEMARLAPQVYGNAPIPEPGIDDPGLRTAPVSADTALDLAAQGARASAILNAWYKDRSHPVNNRHDPRHKEAVAIAQRLEAVASHKRNVDPRALADRLFQRARTRRAPKP